MMLEQLVQDIDYILGSYYLDSANRATLDSISCEIIQCLHKWQHEGTLDFEVRVKTNKDLVIIITPKYEPPETIIFLYVHIVKTSKGYGLKCNFDC